MNHRPFGFISGWTPPRVPSRFASVRATSLLTILGVGLIFLIVLPRSSPDLKQPEPIFAFPSDTLKSSIVDVDSLIQAIQNASRRASGGLDPAEFNRTARDLWYENNPCRSREQMEPLYTLRRFVKDVEHNPKWKEVFREYEKLHRACTQNIGSGNISAYFSSKDNSSGCQFLVAGIAPKAGLGNKILSMVSGLLYAILTQRVFLIPAETLVPGIMCEPFEGSSWLFDTERELTPEYETGKQKYWIHSAQFYTEVDDAKSGKTPGALTSIYALSPNDNWCHPGARFFCDTEQVFLLKVPWLYVNGCFYYLPKLFAIPSFRPVLEDLFPDRMALTQLLRASMLPSDDVWRRIEQIYSAYLSHADRRVGFQVRYRYGDEDFNKTHNLVTERVLRCAVDNDILPGNGANTAVESNSQLGRTDDFKSGQAGKKKKTTVFITSLYPSLHDFLSDMYVRNPPAMEDVALIQITHGHLQHYNDEEDKQALTEMISLSFSDHLFVTPLSTFGGIAQGYGALVPWFIDNRPESKDACIRAQTVDTCYQVPDFKFSCPHEPRLNNEWVLATVPYLKDCLAVDAQYGIQLITS